MAAQSQHQLESQCEVPIWTLLVLTEDKTETRSTLHTTRSPIIQLTGHTKGARTTQAAANTAGDKDNRLHSSVGIQQAADNVP
jgi:hypothetical protein